MSTPHFDFKRFRICHDRCAMKVGTDGVLLGAWADVASARRLLDIGTGSGLIALMAAQRAQAQVIGIEIDAAAAGQARENAAASPFAHRVEIITTALQDFAPDAPFDCILSNPPFFEEDLLPPDAARAAARNAAALPFPVLAAHAARLLSPDGSFQIIVPATAAERFQGICAMNGFALKRRTDVLTSSRKPPKRSLLHFVRDPWTEHPERTALVLTAPDGTRSEDYQALTHDFYL